MQKVIDLTHGLSPGMPIYPGTDPPVFRTGCTIAEDGFREKEIRFCSHTGTHVDAPAHLLEEGKSLDQFPIAHFWGKAVLIAVPPDEKIIGPDHLTPFAESIRGADFLLVKTGWARFWGTPRYFEEFPVLTLPAAEWLARQRLKGVGLDTISADPMDTKEYAVHKTLLKQEMIIIENLNLEPLEDLHSFSLSCFPLKIDGADGSPVRAVAITPPDSRP